VVVLLFDVEKELSAVDKKLARYVADHYKPVILGANKWDRVMAEHGQREFVEYIRAEMPGVAYAPIVFLSAKTGKGVGRLLETAERLWQDVHARVPTGELNRVLERATEARSPTKDGHRVRIYYATQAETVPPTIVVFVNDKRLLGKDYLRYLSNRLRAEQLFEHVPIHIEVRDKQQQQEER
jgi:GTP-binding protein